MNVSSIRENTQLAMQTLVSHKFRAALTILGVFIGVLVIVAMAAVLNGFRQSIVDQSESFGTRNVYIWRFPFIMTSRPPAEVLNRKPLSLEDAQAIGDEVPQVEHVYAGLIYGIPIPGEPPPLPPEARYRERVVRRTRFIGNFPVAERVMNVPVNEGRYFSDAENEHRATVCVLGFNIVEALFPGEDPVGKTINVGGQDFVVIGAVKKQKAGPFGSENQEDNDVFVPYYTFHKMYPKVNDHFIIVRMREGQMAAGIQAIEQVLRRRRNVPLSQDNNFEIGTPESFISTFDDIVRLVFVVMLIMSGVAFMVGGVGVMNIMLVAVTERTHEIGIRKAVGATRSDIILQFMTEAVTLTGLGGLAGLLIGWGFAKTVSALVPSLYMVIPLWAAAFGFFGSVTVGLVFGLWPAMKAARLDPITALRHE